MGPETFTKAFGPMHVEYWDGVWSIMMKRLKGIPLSDDEHVFLAIIFRGGGKSSNVEWTAIMEGALLGRGYALYLSGTQDLAQGHLEAIRDRLERSQVAKYYPGLANPKVGKYGQRFGWRQDALVTASGWGIAAFGLDTGIRGGKLVDQRPTLIICDDIDSLEDTPVTVNKKIDILSRSVFPSGTADTVILGAQNLIHVNSVMNKIVNRTIGLLANRRQTQTWPAIRGLKTERIGARDMITAGTPTWPDGYPLEAAQREIDRDGLDAFLAEHQHDFTSMLEGLLIPEFNESVHVISWSEFASLYGVKGIPDHWLKDVGLDWGSTGLTAHPTVVSFIATAAEDSAFPGLHFLYHGMTFGEGVMVQDVGDRILTVTGEIEDYHEDERRKQAKLDGYHRWVASHEAKSERDTFRRLYGIPFQTSKSSATSGVSQWRAFMRTDYEMQHLFKKDAKGFALFYWIVDDDQLISPWDDRGLKRWREEVVTWRWRPQDVGQAGLVRETPVKFMDDASDSIRYLTAAWLAPRTPLTASQVYENKLPSPLQRDKMPPSPGEAEQWAFARWLQQGRLQKREEMVETRNNNSE